MQNMQRNIINLYKTKANLALLPVIPHYGRVSISLGSTKEQNASLQ